jgi:hypothetical protein
MRRSDSIFLVALACLITALNAVKPAVVDDTAYLLFARHLSHDPLHPYAFTLFWYDAPQPAMTVLMPPVLPYWLALGISLFGEHLWLLKLWLFPFVSLLAWSVWQILARFAPGQERIGTVLILFSPVVLPLINVMLDIPAVALGLASTVFVMRAQSRGTWGAAILAGILGALAGQTKYSLFTLPLVWFAFGVTHRAIGKVLLATMIAVGLFVGWERLLFVSEGVSHFQYHAMRVPDGPPRAFEDKLAELIAKKCTLIPPGIAFLGGMGTVWGLLAWQALRWPRSVMFGVMIFGLLGSAGVALLSYSDAVLAVNPKTNTATLTLPHVVFHTLGWATVFMAVASGFVLLFRCPIETPRESRRSDWFLILWLAVEVMGYFALTPFPAGRRIILPTLALAFLVLRLTSTKREQVGNAHHSLTLRARQFPAHAAIVAWGIGNGILLYAIDSWDACVEPRMAEQALAVAKAEGQGKIWTQGHWGWQYTMDCHGAELIEPGVSVLQPGDWLIVPILPDDVGFYRPYHGEAVFQWNEEALEYRAGFEWKDGISAMTVPCLYGGHFPWEGRDHPRLKVHVYRVKSRWIPSPKR